MKRYPFSKKAVQAILAASLALTPVAGLGTVNAQASETEYTVTAASYQASDLIKKFNKIYAELNKPGNADTLQKVQQAQEKIQTLNWNEYAKQIVRSDDQAKINDMAELLKIAAEVAASTTAAELQSNLNALSSKSSEIAASYDKNISAQDIEGLIVGAALEFYNNVKQLNPDATEAQLNKALEEAVQTAVSNIQNPQLFQVLLNNISLGEVSKAAKAIFNEVDPEAELRKAFLQVVKKVERGTPGPGPSPDPDPEPIPYTPGPDEVKVPLNAINIEKINGQYVTTILTNKVDEVVGQITDSKNILVLPLPQAATGEVNKAIIPGAFFTKAAEKNADAALLVKTTEAGYKLPVTAISIAELAQKLGVSADEVQIEITVSIVNVNDVQGTISKNKLKPVSKVIEFTVKAKAGGKEQLISTFRTYVEREIIADKVLDPKHTAALRLNDNGTISPVPVKVAGNVGTIKSPSNSKYVLVENDKTFNDVNNGANYFEENIEKLASKYIINGKTETSYAPSANITRGEFAALISRGLGLVAINPAEAKFSDVSANQAVNKNGEINAAVEAGIIQGFPNGTFKPNQPITRAEAAIMIDRAMKFTNVPAAKFDSARTITEFKDAASIGTSSRDSIEKVVQAGIMDGFQNGEFGAYKHTQRDQMAKVLDKFLQASNLIN